MKKFIISSITILSILFVLLVSNHDRDRQSSLLPSENNIIDITSSVSAKDKNSVKIDMGNVSMSSPIQTDEEKFEISNSVVLRGKVINSHYVLDGSTVYTKSEVEVIDCYQGNLSAGDTVFVRELGGFVPSDVYSNAIYSEKYGNNIIPDANVENKILDVRIEDFKVMETSEDVILFLVPITQTSLDEFSKGCYDLIRMWQGKLLYNKEYDAYIPYIPEYELANEVNKTSSVYQIKSPASSSGTVQAKIYSLEEFESLAESIVKNK